MLYLPFIHLEKNPNLPRSLDEEGRSAVVSYLINNKHAEWDDGSKTSLRLIFKTPETLAGEVFSWAESEGNPSLHEQTINFNHFHHYAFSGITGSVLTIYELCKAEEYQNTSFFGSDYTSLRAALEILQGNSIYQLAWHTFSFFFCISWRRREVCSTGGRYYWRNRR